MLKVEERYTNAVPELQKTFKYENIMQVPKLVKVVINTGVGEAVSNSKALETAEADIVAIAGQHPVITRAKRSVANFKLRAGMPIGLKVTLRGQRMYDFLNKLFFITLPRVRDFQGVSNTAFDEHGNYTLGFKDHSVFPEIDFNKIEKPRGLEVCIVTTANTPEEGKKLLELLGMPFSKD
ncbi:MULTISPECIES: 50S ribosomal protein L5 [Dehalococcoides]|jgi:large subunit ribosomal protein L5|uniref:Large ribosomal subunit protein uL5 n=1 Tax=Dehalococcoides mccartyi TaxID=61435 RepID=A0A0V8M4K9_9CHLR|nr:MULTISPECIES: 50S ribosomal protein L5 [Dehalococcoides]AHB13195.1 50S ribosomal protein L5 [Dehalococcoides mccartyi GY50]AII57631.1 50S ribosomal protein L5 [Dehalococcoides mccartyi CG1]APH12116.1 50S ribosomal protein L5 [Dehalococcoides mccartyi]KSV18703.1 50S ribosomal protein L5 [Dehalococcoides mccartyi]UJP38277.1 50S ribosomal protein L5 [Dehalococcoides mccartyi]